MAKYNRLDEPLRKAKAVINIVETQRMHDESTLKQYDKKRRFEMTKDLELLQFGCDLYHAGYTLDDVKNDIEIYRQLLNEGKTINDNCNIFTYENVGHIPSIDKFTTIAKNSDFFMSIEYGYNIERRKDLAEEIKNGMKRK